MLFLVIMDRFRTLFQTGLRDPWFLANFVLRIAALIWVLTRGTSILGDSEYYLESMRSIWRGEWGGATYRAPGFAWFLAATGPTLVLILQSLGVWLVGIDLSKRASRLAGLLWVFDPALFAYSHSIMSDALFALSIYGCVLAFLHFRTSQSLKAAIGLGVLLAVSALTRPIGIPFALLTIAFAVFPISALRIRQVGLGSFVFIALLSPRLYWNAQHGSGWTIAAQGANFQMSVAAAVEYAGTGLTYTETETKWIAEHPDPRLGSLIRQTLFQKWKTWLALSIKGIARTLVGHANIEAAVLVSGHPVTGPGWFSEGNQGPAWSAIEKAFWVLGILFAMGFALFEYVFSLRSFPRSTASEKVFSSWALLAAAGFVVSTQLFGDCRFRLPVVAILLATGISKRKQAST
jgi:4-amino-4-deoxy-L-arabinose transferase-like glycosyltransferase